MYLKVIAMILNLPASSPQRGFVPHRWLSAYDASMATHVNQAARARIKVVQEELNRKGDETSNPL